MGVEIADHFVNDTVCGTVYVPSIESYVNSFSLSVLRMVDSDTNSFFRSILLAMPFGVISADMKKMLQIYLR